MGHIVKDIVPGGWRPGGGAYYAAAQAARFGLEVVVVTSCSPEIEPAKLLPRVDWQIVPSETSTTFENSYADGKRSQRILAQAQRISLADIPADWREAPMSLVTPVFEDVDDDLPAALNTGHNLVGVGGQGWLRRLDGDVVKPKRVKTGPWLAGDVVFVSDEDVEHEHDVQAWRSRVPVVILTRAHRGCTVWTRGSRHEIPALEVEEVDPTGAGDVFAAAFLIRYREIHEARTSAIFASAAAALAISGVGAAKIGDRAAIDALARAHGTVRAQ
ncbi:MAG TPA: PfkB family carbohydrate kinase [Dehalococcoidia bacterium]|nr:PfkB family carbohydrate kinase [Dehalococcoidia bacterium]